MRLTTLVGMCMYNERKEMKKKYIKRQPFGSKENLLYLEAQFREAGKLI